MRHATAILLFSRTAREEALHKPFSNQGVAVNEQIANHLISHAEKTARQTGLPVVFVSSDDQQGNSFGEKLANAFRLVFSQGFGKVLAIGNDCPYLTARLLQEAATRLQTEEVVTGPAKDGGAYLIGLSAASFKGEDFGQLAWQTPAFYQSLLTYCRTHGLSHGEFSSCGDLDTDRDLASFLRQSHQPASLVKLVRLIRNLLLREPKPCSAIACALHGWLAEASLFRRGPPRPA